MPKVFWSLTPNEYSYWAEGQMKKDEFDLQVARQIMWSNLQPHNKRKIDPRDLLPLPSDGKIVRLNPNVDEATFLKKKERIKKRYGGGK